MRASLQLIRTEDGSSTLYHPAVGEHYHSIHGAVEESQHVFIEMGLSARLEQPYAAPLQILEIGLGTGLNALLTLLSAGEHPIHYTALEPFPLGEELSSALSFPQLGLEGQHYLECLHRAPWGRAVPLEGAALFSLEKLEIPLACYERQAPLDLIYFDAFSPESQPELWTEELFARIFAWARPGAVLTTYSAKGEVRRRLQRAGWFVERLPGPPHKREMLRATRR